MQESTDIKRKVILATGNDGLVEKLTQYLTKHVKSVVVVVAKDGADADFKISNSLPHVLIVDSHLAKRSGTKLVEWILTEYKDKRIGCIIFPEVPDKSIFVDEVVSGRVQFLDEPENEDKFSACVAKAIHYASNSGHVEFKIRNLKSGEVLIKEGEKAESVFLLKSGQMSAYLIRSDKEVPLGEIEPGEFVGEMSYIHGEPRSASVRALTGCELIEIPITQMDQVLFGKPAWAKALMKTLAKRVKTSNQVKG